MGKKSKRNKAKSVKQKELRKNTAGMHKDSVSLPSVRSEEVSDPTDKLIPGENRDSLTDLLPEEFLDTMKVLLSDDYEAYIVGSESDRHYGLRVNTLKISPEEFEKRTSFHIKRIPWIEGGYYYDPDDRPGRHPDYAAGLYYLQEPSAMTPASRLPVRPGDRVLDLCAAPGGKATALGAALGGKGILLANDINRARARALLHNIELFGIDNALVCAEAPYRLARRFPEYFDRIMVDAPCSGEGMFRKNPAVIEAWKEKGPEYFSDIQKEIVLHAADMLRPGGMMLYSTCTFSPLENEAVISRLLAQRPEMEVIPMEDYEGFSPGITSFRETAYDESMVLCRRIWPHRMEGEGHFLALLRKKGAVRDRTFETAGTGKSRDESDPEVKVTGIGKSRDESDSEVKTAGTGKGRDDSGFGKKSSRTGKSRAYSVREADRDQAQSMEEFFGHIHTEEGPGREKSFDLSGRRVKVCKGKIFYLPEEAADMTGLECLREGLYVGELKKKRFEPAQALALALRESRYDRTIDIPKDHEWLCRYLKGESLPVPEIYKTGEGDGLYLVLADGYPLGFGKVTKGMLKNKYPAGWRWT